MLRSQDYTRMEFEVGKDLLAWDRKHGRDCNKDTWGIFQYTCPIRNNSDDLNLKEADNTRENNYFFLVS